MCGPTQARFPDRNAHALHALLARPNLQPTSGRSWMTVRGLREMAALPLGSIPGAIREHSRALLKVLDEQIRWLDLELGEMRRFPSAKHVASYVGLTPRVRATATTVRLGHVSKEGNRLLRWALVLAATQAARRPGPLRAWFRVIQQRKGTKAARVALARPRWQTGQSSISSPVRRRIRARTDSVSVPAGVGGCSSRRRGTCRGRPSPGPAPGRETPPWRGSSATRRERGRPR